MFNRDGIFGKKDDQMRKDSRNVNLTPSLQPAPGVARSSAPEATRPEPQVAEPPKPAPASEDGQGSKLIVGPDIKLKGVEITDCDTLVVEGRVEAVLQDCKNIEIMAPGEFKGAAEVDVADISGQFNGDLTCRQRLIVRAGGKVLGKIRYGQLEIERGGVLSGEVEVLPEAQIVQAPTAAVG
jgi:cytoskeletal protein CcmA (bactofilin family)